MWSRFSPTDVGREGFVTPVTHASPRGVYVGVTKTNRSRIWLIRGDRRSSAGFFRPPPRILRPPASWIESRASFCRQCRGRKETRNALITDSRPYAFSARMARLKCSVGFLREISRWLVDRYHGFGMKIWDGNVNKFVTSGRARWNQAVAPMRQRYCNSPFLFASTSSLEWRR